MKSAVAATAGLLIAAPLFLAAPAAAHGWVTDPPSRQDNCAKGATSFDCGSIKYEPQSVEAPKGSLQCSGGSGFDILDDESRPWPTKQVGSSVNIQWKLTAAHNTSTWEYFVDGQLHQVYEQNGRHLAHSHQSPCGQAHYPRSLERCRHSDGVLQLHRRPGRPWRR
jgi:predicted carbohydrate-binding protein with CBM5 and CBM33 domain